MKAFNILSYHPGRQHNLEQAVQLKNAFHNFKHATSFYFDPKTVQTYSRVSAKLYTGMKRRSCGLEAANVDTYSIPEARLLLKRALGFSVSITDYINRNERFQRWMLQRYAPPKICVGFDTASWMVFEEWKGKSFLVLDLSIAAPQFKLTLARENKLNTALVEKLTKDDAAVYGIYAKELQLADMILCGSSFVKDSCLALGINDEKMRVLPYGADLSLFSPAKTTPNNSKPIKVVFVGSVNHRKGADVVLKAWQRLAKDFRNIELHFYGNVQMELPPAKGIVYHGFINQANLINELRTAHISVLPSFFEGSSLAIYQSMAMGLAVVTTPNAGSVIENEYNGLLVPYGDEEALYQCLLRLIIDPEHRQMLADHARHDIKQYTWDAYGKKLATLLKLSVHELAFA